MTTSAELLGYWGAARAEHGASLEDDGPALARRLAEVLDDARARWPRDWLTDEDLVGMLAARVESAQELAQLDGAALYLALACASGNADAIVAFERAHGRELSTALSGATPGAAALSLEDLRQMLWVRLFVGDGVKPPAIAGYRGRGPLGRWVYVTARREVLQTLRKRTAIELEFETSRQQLRHLLADPELDYLEQDYRESFSACFKEAIDALTVRERNLLRQSLVDGLNVRQIGRMYGVHFTTAARWITQAREHLAEQTRARFMTRLHMTPGELGRVIDRIASHVELRVSKVFRPDPSSEPSA